MQAKKYLIVLILRILETNTDKERPMTQTAIANLISGAGYPCDRKTVGRNINFLKSVGYPVVKTSGGFYMDKRVFSRQEADFVCGAVAAGSCSDIDKEDLLRRLKPLLYTTYRSTK